MQQNTVEDEPKNFIVIITEFCRQESFTGDYFPGAPREISRILWLG